METYVYELSAPYDDLGPYLIVARNLEHARELASLYFDELIGDLYGDPLEDYGYIVMTFDGDLSDRDHDAMDVIK